MNIKKIFNIIIIYTVFIFITSSCTIKTDKSKANILNDNNIEKSTEMSIISNPIIKSAELLANIDEDYEIIGLHNSDVIISKGEWNRNEQGDFIESRNYIFYKYNLQSSQKIDLLKLNYSGTGSGDYLIMNNNLLINSTLIQESPSYNLLFELNLDNKNFEQIEKKQIFPPFQFLSSLNDEEIIIFEPNKNYDFENAYDYIIKKYSVITREYDELIKTSYYKDSNEGKLINSVFCSNNKIYVLSITSTDKYYFEIFDSNGILLSETPFADLGNYLSKTQNSIWDMKIYSNYFIFNTMNGEILIYKLFNNNLEKINADLSELKHNNLRLSKINQNEYGRYIYFYRYLSDTINLFDTITEKIIPIKINIDNKWNQVEQMQIDGNGNAVISVIMNNDFNYKKYYYLKNTDFINY